MSYLDPLTPKCTELLLEYVQLGVLLVLTLLYLVPSSIFLKRYGKHLDSFSSWMILVYLFGFLSNRVCMPHTHVIVNLTFEGLDIWLKHVLIDRSREIKVDDDFKDCPYIALIRRDAYFRRLKSLSQAMNFFEHQAFIISFNFFIFKL